MENFSHATNYLYMINCDRTLEEPENSLGGWEGQGRPWGGKADVGGVGDCPPQEAQMASLQATAIRLMFTGKARHITHCLNEEVKIPLPYSFLLHIP